MSDSYRLILETRPRYLHATVVGTRTPENAMRFLREVHAACVERGMSAVLLEMKLAGPSLDSTSIFGVISTNAPAGAMLRRIAYVEAAPGDPARAALAETVAVNRGVNVRLFPDVGSAAAWLEQAQ